jgi:hypothetical protein
MKNFFKLWFVFSKLYDSHFTSFKKNNNGELKQIENIQRKYNIIGICLCFVGLILNFYFRFNSLLSLFIVALPIFSYFIIVQIRYIFLLNKIVFEPYEEKLNIDFDNLHKKMLKK